VSAGNRIVTFLFTDIEGSSAWWQENAAAMSKAVEQHDALTRTQVERHAGTIVKSTGDGVFAVFDDPLGALRSALDLQRALLQTPSSDAVALRIRVGIHVGHANVRDGDYFGNDVNRAARMMSVAHGGQTVVSSAVAELTRGRLDPDLVLKDLGPIRLRGLAAAEHLH